jgi:hypothetical protein
MYLQQLLAIFTVSQIDPVPTPLSNDILSHSLPKNPNVRQTPPKPFPSRHFTSTRADI